MDARIYYIEKRPKHPLNIMDIMPTCMPLLGTTDSGMDRFVREILGRDEVHT